MLQFFFQMVPRVLSRVLGRGGEVSCRELVEQWFAEVIAAELGVSEEEARDEIPWNLDLVDREYRGGRWSFVPCRMHGKASRALRMVEDRAPDVAEILENRCFVFTGDREIPAAMLESIGVMTPFIVDRFDVSRAVVALDGLTIRFAPLETVAFTLAHEALHVDLLENPERYGIRDADDMFAMFMFNLDEKPINQRVEALGFETMEQHKERLAEARNRAFQASREMEGFTVSLTWPDQLALRFLACDRGTGFSPRFGAPPEIET